MCIRENIWNDEIIVPLGNLDELNNFVKCAFLMLLSLRVHISRADGNERRAAVVDDVAFFVELLAERFSEELDIPFRDALEVIAVRHHYFNVATMLLSCGELKGSVKHCRIIPDIVILTSLVHMACAFEEFFNVHSDNCRSSETNFTEDGEATTNTIRHCEGLPTIINCKLLEQSLLLHVGISDSDNFNLNVVFFEEGIVHHHKVAHGVESAATLGNDDQHNLIFAVFVRLCNCSHCLEVVDNIAGAACVDILTAEVDFRHTLALLFGPGIPELAAEDIKENLVAEEGAADTERDNCVNIVANTLGEVVESLNAGR